MTTSPSRIRTALLLFAASLLTGCAAAPPAPDADTAEQVERFVAETSATSVLGPDAQFAGSPYEDVGLTGLFPVRGPDDCRIAVLEGGEDSFAARLNLLKDARRSIRIQALVFKGDETGLRIAEILKQKKAAGLDVRVIVDALSNPWLQTQWMYFDLKQNGIEVEGYEAMALQWLNEVPVPKLVPHTDPDALDKRFHEKMWIIDGETDQGVAVTGGLNIGNEYFRANPDDPDATWRDQDVVVRGGILRARAARRTTGARGCHLTRATTRGPRALPPPLSLLAPSRSMRLHGTRGVPHRCILAASAPTCVHRFRWDALP